MYKQEKLMKNNLRSILFASAAFVFLIVSASQANAQASRTFVSGVGDDVNPCSRTAPCKTFAGAISKTAAGGEIDALDPGGYGGVTITKSITINGAGTLASILVSGANGITVNAGASDVVILRNLSFVGLGTGLNAVNFLGGGQLNIENCEMRGFSTNGININSTTAGSVFVKDTSIANTNTAINIAAGTTGITASLDNVRLQGQTIGLNVASNAVVSISNSVISQNSDAGIAAANTAQVNAESVKITNNGTGIRAANTSIVRMSNLNIFNNTVGISRTETGVLASFSNNKIAGNGTQGAPTAYLSNQ